MRVVQDAERSGYVSATCRRYVLSRRCGSLTRARDCMAGMVDPNGAVPAGPPAASEYAGEGG